MAALTVEAWVLPRNVASYTGMSIVSKRNANLDNDVYNLFVYTGRLVNGRINANSTTGNIGLSKTVIADNTWYHLAFVFDGKATGTEKLNLSRLRRGLCFAASESMVSSIGPRGSGVACLRDPHGTAVPDTL